MSLSRAFAQYGALLASAAHDVDSELQSAWELGSLAYPGTRTSAHQFAAFLGARIESSSQTGTLALEDLFLACGCTLGDEVALALFESRFRPEISLALLKVPYALPMSDEVSQAILVQLLVPDEEGVRGISSYRGRGSLFSWLRVITVRRALRELGKQQRTEPIADEQILASLQPATDLSYMQETYREAFQEAFRQAIAELDDDARTMLRHHYVHGLSIDKLSLLHKIHRATAARRLAKARESVLVATRRRLLGALRITTEELDSIMRLIASNLEGSIGGLMSSLA